MVTQSDGTDRPPRRFGRSTVAVLLGLLLVVALSLGTDQLRNASTILRQFVA